VVTEAAVWAALADVRDPEIPPVSIVDLGMVYRVVLTAAGAVRIRVEITPTYVGCPALEIIRRDVAARLGALEGVAGVEVAFVLDPPWTSDRITPEGRERLRSFGIAPPSCSRASPSSARAGADPSVPPPLTLILPTEAPPCPYCGSLDTHLENLFGPTACRSIYYCDGCRQPFEGMRSV